MTTENRRQNIQDELARARLALQAAEALAGLGLAADSVSRAYYGVFHLLRGLLLSHGVEPKTHAGAIHLFNVEFVRPALFPSSFNRLLSQLQRTRELADYDAAISFSPEDALSELAMARDFEGAVLVFLAREGWIIPDDLPGPRD